MENNMKIEQYRWTTEKGWDPALSGKLGSNVQLVLLFGSPACLKQADWHANIVRAYPNAHILGCSTAGEIYGTEVADETLVATAIAFEHTNLYGTSIKVDDRHDSYQAGKQLADALPRESLIPVLVISDGQNVNGSKLVAGLTEHLPPHVTLTGGLAGDG